ncbi:hypothetical protein QWY93_16875 [Echinicola jeungdonensis]|uniref:Tetratricopeptide repeat protein n=1 Tax=Echinicola jeungdonensis TaxID=709343 RepID=A0ABV5J6N1_9BACT|nr:hypothetical protein [Echinicola jeungdonensis]MDN3670990.1 hypothetical protein [Echinicola jeungdonensis]
MGFINKNILILLLLIPSSWKEISEKNEAIEKAAAHYAEEDYEAAVRDHLALINDYGIHTEKANFDLALSYQLNGQEEDAQQKYSELAGASQNTIASAAINQKGVLLGNQKKHKEALEAFKLALIKNPSNEEARYNYELLARWLEKNEDQQKDENEDSKDKKEPSNYAKRMKAKADELVDQFKFNEALDVMNSALEIDETVSQYQEFIKNLSDINEINEN